LQKGKKKFNYKNVKLMRKELIMSTGNRLSANVFTNPEKVKKK